MESETLSIRQLSRFTFLSALFAFYFPLSPRFQSLTRATYPSKLLFISVRESPPNFYLIASARTMASIDSQTTPQAGTAVTSLRSHWDR